MTPPSHMQPDDSTLWQWWVPPADGVMTEAEKEKVVDAVVA